MANWPEYKKFNLILLAALTLPVVSFFITAVIFYDIPHLIIVHFDAFNGIDFLGTKYDVLWICGVAFSMAIINFLLARAFFSRDKFLAWSLSFGNLALMILVLMAILVIVFNN
jgi:hydrogenase-4 membrane subunit HyfE